MTQTVAYGTAFNPANTFVPDVYEQVVPPQAYFGGTPTSISASSGTASWGKKNSPQLIAAPSQEVKTFGGITPASLNDPHDLCRDMTIALNQAQGSAGLMHYGVRVSDGTDTQAKVVIYDSTTGTVTFTGTLTTGDVINLLFTNVSLPQGSYNLKYTVLSGDNTLTKLALSVVTAINGDSTLSGANFVATSNLGVVTITWPNTEGGVNITANANGVTTATIGGTVTTGDAVAIIVHNTLLAGGMASISYTTQGGDTLATIAAALNTAINASSALQLIGVTSTVVGAAVSIRSTSNKVTTYTNTITPGGTETVTFAGGPTEIIAVSGQNAIITIWAKWTGVKGNELLVIPTVGTKTGTITVKIIPFAGGGSVEIYPNLPGAADTFGPALMKAINQGISSTRGPSNLCVATDGIATLRTAVLGTYTLSGGTDGRAVTTTQLVGNEQDRTGIYTLQNAQFAPSVMWVGGLTDSIVYTEILSFAKRNNIFTLFAFPAGTGTDDAVALKNGYGIVDYQAGFVQDHMYWFDQINNQVLLVPPLAAVGGMLATLPPWASPMNMSIQGMLGTERNNPFTGDDPYFYSELNQLGQAGIMVATNSVPGGNYLGMRNPFNSVGNNQPTAVVEYSRMTNYLVQSNGLILGKYLGKLQGLRNNDPVRAQVRTEVNTFYQNLYSQNYVADYSVICDRTNNSFATIAGHELIIAEQITYMSSILYIFPTIQGGTTVVANANQTGPQLSQLGILGTLNALGLAA